MKASWQGKIIAQSSDTIIVESNHYFPLDSLTEGCFKPSDHRTHCGWKGEAHYYHIEVDGQVNQNAAWYYPEPLPKANNIKGRVAFWKGVEVTA